MSSIAASSVAAYAAIAAAAASVASVTVQGVSNYRQGKVAEFQNQVNKSQALEAEKQAYQEESLNATQHHRRILHEIAAGQNLLAGMGNIGTSAESALRGGYFNLSEDLSALKYKYDAEAAGHRTEALNYQYNADATKKNRRMGVLASGINVTGATMKGVSNVYDAGVTANWWNK